MHSLWACDIVSARTRRIKMQLKEYLEKNHYSVNYTAQALGVHPQTVRSIIKGVRHPGYALARSIEAFSEGEVTTDDLLADKLEPPICPCCKRKIYGKQVKLDLSVLKD